jgi:proliferating cell nuclear antigen PCNA
MAVRKDEYLIMIKTNEGFTIKILSELIQNFVNIACFTFSEEGIFLKTTNSEDSCMIDLNLYSDNFPYYYCSESQNIGFNLNKLHNSLKSIKKKDLIEIYRTKKEPDEIVFKIKHFDTKRSTIRHIPIVRANPIGITIPSPYSAPIINKSVDVQKALKDVHSSGKEVKLVSQNKWFKFYCQENMGKSVIELGDIEEVNPSLPLYEQNFCVNLLIKLTKISNLSSNVWTYIDEKLPLKIRMNVGNLGDISIFIKTKTSIEECQDEEGEEEIDI